MSVPYRANPGNRTLLMRGCSGACRSSTGDQASESTSIRTYTDWQLDESRFWGSYWQSMNPTSFVVAYSLVILVLSACSEEGMPKVGSTPSDAGNPESITTRQTDASGVVDVTRDNSDSGSLPTDVKERTIETGQRITATPGIGAGLFVEYESGGRWRVFTACDTETSGFPCTWDVVASVAADDHLELVETIDLETEDLVEEVAPGALRLQTSTALGFDGLLAAAPPGSPIRVDALLDGREVPELISWIHAGTVQRARANPVDLHPTEP